jgi:putative ABC transport system permease protein
MELRERLWQARQSLAQNPRRVVASAMGVFWGSAAIVIMLAWGTGFRDYMKREFERYGRPAVMVIPGVSSSGFPGYRPGVPVRVSHEDARVAEQENSELVEAVVAEHFSDERLLVEARGRVRRLDMTATDHRFLHYRNFRIGEGRFFDAEDVERGRPVAVLGYEAARELLEDPKRDLGRTIRISGEPFELIGIMDEKSGRQYNNTNRPENRLLLLPSSAAESRLGFDEDRVTLLRAYTRPGVDNRAVLRGVVASVARRRGLHPEDTDAFRHFDMSSTTRLLDLMHAGFALFIGIAGTITLLIGGVGIANYHLAMLAEREVEIGVAKAIGARNGSLMTQSALESLLVSGAAALAGVGLGLGGCAALEHLTPPGMFPTPVVSGLVIGITLCALVGVAVVAALVPALRVRRMDISIALRAEI